MSGGWAKVLVVVLAALILVEYLWSEAGGIVPLAPWRKPTSYLHSSFLNNSFTDRHPLWEGGEGEEGICPLVPPGLLGPLKRVVREVVSLEEAERMVGEGVGAGGTWRPAHCKARDRVALIVPYRDRPHHLCLFLANIHPFLQRQLIDYAVFVIEQAGSGDFNRGMLMNIGFVEAVGLREFDCFIFHDVDLLPEDDRNLYTCPDMPRHMSAAVDVFNYRLPYADIFGGVSAMRREQFEKVNGFSNMFWGWGGEDDDMAQRIKAANLHISRYPVSIARYTMLHHKKQKANPKR